MVIDVTLVINKSYIHTPMSIQLFQRMIN